MKFKPLVALKEPVLPVTLTPPALVTVSVPPELKLPALVTVGLLICKAWLSNKLTAVDCADIATLPADPVLNVTGAPANDWLLLKLMVPVDTALAFRVIVEDAETVPDPETFKLEVVGLLPTWAAVRETPPLYAFTSPALVKLVRVAPMEAKLTLFVPLPGEVPTVKVGEFTVNVVVESLLLLPIEMPLATDTCPAVALSVVGPVKL